MKLSLSTITRIFSPEPQLQNFKFFFFLDTYSASVHTTLVAVLIQYLSVDWQDAIIPEIPRHF